MRFHGTKQDLDKFLRSQSPTIGSLPTTGDESQLLNPRYLTQQSDAETMFDNSNSNTKAPAWTDSLEVEAGDAFAKFTTPLSVGLLNKSHIYKVFARHRIEGTLRKRDEVFLSVLDKAEFLVSVKARHGAEE